MQCLETPINHNSQGPDYSSIDHAIRSSSRIPHFHQQGNIEMILTFRNQNQGDKGFNVRLSCIISWSGLVSH